MTDLGCLGLIQSQFWLFRHDSRQISACFSRFNLFWLPTDTTRFGWYSPILAELVGIRGKKKKKAQTWHRRAGSHVERRTLSQATSNSGATPSQLRPCFIGVWWWWTADIDSNLPHKTCAHANDKFFHWNNGLLMLSPLPGIWGLDGESVVVAIRVWKLKIQQNCKEKIDLVYNKKKKIV